jgi:Holliday junction resolvase-like predicted endonuclease
MLNEKPINIEPSKRALGDRAEKKAIQWFQRQGYIIKHSNWYHGHKELDLVVESSKDRIFVEVKFNNDRSTNFPEAKVNKNKREFLRHCAKSYNFEYPTTKSLRFDVLAITESSFSLQIYHIKDAFYGKASSMKYPLSAVFYA